VTAITFAGALFLAIVAVSPSVISLAVPDLATSASAARAS
jgi:hypothetical protein